MRGLFVLLAGLLGLAAIEAGAQEPYTYKLTIPPGKFVVTNFVLNTGSRVVVVSRGTPNVMVSGFAHPSSELTISNNELQVRCPGAQSHEIKISAETPANGNELVLVARERGHYGVFWQNQGTAAANVDVVLTPEPNSQFVFTESNAGDFQRAP